MLNLNSETTILIIVATKATIKSIPYTMWRFVLATVFEGRFVVVGQCTKGGESMKEGVDIHRHINNGRVFEGEVAFPRNARYSVAVKQ